MAEKRPNIVSNALNMRIHLYEKNAIIEKLNLPEIAVRNIAPLVTCANLLKTVNSFVITCC